MREHREAGRAGEGRREALVDRRDDRRDGAVARGEPIEDRRLTLAAMVDERAHEALRLAHRPAVAGPIDGLRATRSLSSEAM